MMNLDEIKEAVRAAVGRQLQEPKTGVIEAINDTPYTVTVNVNGQVESVQAKFDPSMYDKIYVGLPVQLVVNEDNELEIIGSNPTASREAWAGEYPETAIVGLVDLDQGGTNADLSNADDGVVLKSGSSIQTLDNGTNGQVLTIASGVPAWGAGISTPISVADGGTGRTSVTANSLLIGNGTSALNIITPTIVGSIPVHTGGGLTFSNSPTIGSITTQGGAVFNENGIGTSDIRMESDNNTHQFFIDTSLDALGINESAPDANSALTITADANDAPLQLTPAATPTNLSNGQVWQDSDHNALGIRSAGYTGWASEVKYKMYGTASVTSTSYTSVTTGTSIGTTTIPANYLVPGKFCTMHLRGTVVGGSAGDTVDFQSTIQSTGTLTLTGFAASSSTTYYFDWWIEFWCVTTGASNTIRDHMRVDFVESGSKTPLIAMTRNTTLPSVNTASAATLAPVVKRNTGINGCTIVVTSIDMKLY